MKRAQPPYISQAAFAEAIGVSKATLSRYVHRAEWPVSKSPPWTGKDLDLVNLWRRTLQEDRAQESPPAPSTAAGAIASLGPLQQGRLALTLERVERMKLERQRDAGLLHDVAECRQRRVRQIIEVRTALMYLAQSVAPILVGRSEAEIAELLRDRCESILSAFADGLGAAAIKRRDRARKV